MEDKIIKENVRIPNRLDDWNIEVLESLLHYRSIESENFDFSEKCKNLREGICAMANTSGGYIVLGISEDKDQKSGKLNGFKKNGFKKGEEDKILQNIDNELFEVEPSPKLYQRTLWYNNDSEFCVVIKIEGEDSKKPYVLKNQGKILVRIGSSNKPASRTVILNLYSNYLQKKIQVQKLRSAVILFEQFFKITADNLDWKLNANLKIPLLDLSFMINAIIDCNWLLEEKKLLGGYKTDKTNNSEIMELGLYFTLNELYKFNSLISQVNTDKKEIVIGRLSGYNKNQKDYKNIVDQLDKIIEACDEFLSR